MAHLGDHSNVAGAAAAANNVVSIKKRDFLYSPLFQAENHKIVKGLKSYLLLIYLTSL